MRIDLAFPILENGNCVAVSSDTDCETVDPSRPMYDNDGTCRAAISDCDEHGEQLEKGRCRPVTEYDCMRRKHAYDNNGKKCKPPTSANDCQDVGYCSNSMYHTRKECEYHFETWSTSEFSDGKCKRVCPEGYKDTTISRV